MNGARVAILADTHGTLDERVLAAVQGCDVAVHAGDVGGGEVLAALDRAAARVMAVRGNNDVAAKWLAGGCHAGPEALPDSVSVALPGGTLAVVHGHRALPVRQRHHRLRQQFPDARLVVYGHSHRLCIDRSAEPWVANPGAAGRSRTFGGPSLLLLEAGRGTWSLREQRYPPAR